MISYVIFAHDRSGSSSLARALSVHPEVSFTLDPFHTNYGQWYPDERRYRDSVEDRASLEAVLEEISFRYNGIKVLSYDLPEPIYRHLLLLPGIKVIFLRRRNVLQTVVSGRIADQTKMWQLWDPRFEKDEAYRGLQPLDLEQLEKDIDYQIYLETYYRRILMERPRESRILLNYEDFYTSDLEVNRTNLRRVLSFLELVEADMTEADKFLDPASAKLNTNETYALVPNAEEIEKAFGSDRIGWLFDRS